MPFRQGRAIETWYLFVLFNWKYLAFVWSKARPYVLNVLTINQIDLNLSYVCHVSTYPGT